MVAVTLTPIVNVNGSRLLLRANTKINQEEIFKQHADLAIWTFESPTKCAKFLGNVTLHENCILSDLISVNERRTLAGLGIATQDQIWLVVSHFKAITLQQGDKVQFGYEYLVCQKN